MSGGHNVIALSTVKMGLAFIVERPDGRYLVPNRTGGEADVR